MIVSRAYMDKVVVLLSGGLDSSTALWWSKARWDALAISFNHYRRSRREIEATRVVAERAGVRLELVDLKFVRELADIKAEDEVLSEYKWRYPEYIPNKNLIFFSLAAYWAEVVGAKYIVGGNTKEDLFPDAKKDFLERVNGLISSRLLTEKNRRVEIASPLIGYG